MGIKTFWRDNKYGFMWSCLAFTFLTLFLGTIKKVDISTSLYATMFGIPIIFLMAFGIYEFTGGDK